MKVIQGGAEHVAKTKALVERLSSVCDGEELHTVITALWDMLLRSYGHAIYEQRATRRQVVKVFKSGFKVALKELKRE